MLGVTTENSRNQTFLRSLVIPRTDSVEATFIGKMKDVDLNKAAKAIFMLTGGSNLNIIINVTKFNAEAPEKSYLVTELKNRLLELEPRILIYLVVKPNMINNIYMKDLHALHKVNIYNSELQLKLDLQEKRLATRVK